MRGGGRGLGITMHAGFVRSGVEWRGRESGMGKESDGCMGSSNIR